MLNRAPHSRWLTWVLLATLVALVGYAVLRAGSFGLLIAGLLLVFAGLPALVIMLATWRERRHPH